MGPYYMNLPTQEPPEHIKEAIRTVRAWLLQVEAEERRRSEETRHLFQSAIAVPRPRDWRDEI